MASSSHNVLLAEELIGTVARAFYTDHVVVVLDALVREKYLIEEEIGPRLKLSAKETRKLITQLEAEMLVKSENVPIEDDSCSFWKCFYIDYQCFVNVVRYRVYLMQQALTKQESTELSEVYYKCPTCREVYSSLDVLRMLAGDHKFICAHCCPNENFRSMPSEPFYQLIEIDNRRTLSSLQTMQKKMAEQLRRVDGQHQGIFDLLSRLREANLPHNLPSENIKKGFFSSAIEDEEIAAEIRHNLTYSRTPGGSYLKKRGADHLDKLANVTNTKSRIEVQLHHEKQQATPLAAVDTGYIFDKREATMPAFLVNSRVTGAAEVIKQVESLQAQRGQAQEEVKEELPPPPPQESTVEDDFDDVAWED